MSNRIVIDSEFDVDFDGARCYTLIHKKIITGTGRGSHLLKNKDSIGKVREVELGFYGTFTGALAAYADRCIGNRAACLEDIVKIIKDCQESISKISTPTSIRKVSVGV